MKHTAFATIVEVYIETTRNSDQNLLKLFVAVARPRCASRDVVQIVDALNVEWDLAAVFDRRERAPWVVNSREFKYLAIV